MNVTIPAESGSQEREDARSTTSDAESTFDETAEPDLVDRAILEETEQHESLLGKPRRLAAIRETIRRSKGSPSQRRGRQLKAQADGSGNAELMYEMEGGYNDSSSRSSSESVALKNEKWYSDAPRTSYLKMTFITITILVLFLALAYGSYRASRKVSGQTFFHNGTHSFGPTTILISLDGFRADFLQRGLTPALSAFVASGVSPMYMLPSFPSLTFPNHYTLATGLYPEAHGIVSNSFWDPQWQEEFYYTDISSSMQAKWWGGEPLWVTAEHAGIKTAIHMWPGSEAHIADMSPTYLDKFNGSEALDIKVDRVLHWLDLPQDDRPQFIGAYVPNVDTDGHKYGPNSTEIRQTIAEVDGMLAQLVGGLYLRNLTDIVNIIVVSDHGMATTSNDRLLQLDDLVDVSLIDHIDGWPLRGLRLINPDRDVPIMYQQLLKAASESGSFDVYTRETMPMRYHFSNNDRIAPLWVVPKAGWAVVEKAEFDVEAARQSGERYSPAGLHGYDHEDPLMRAIFVARGPAFPHLPNSRIPVFQNIEVYNIVCDSLDIHPAPNNGTLRLPLKPVGLHSDFDDGKEVPEDPVATPVSGSLPSATASARPPQPTSENTTSEVEGKKSWLKFLQDKLKDVEDWAARVLDSVQNHSSNTKDSLSV